MVVDNFVDMLLDSPQHSLLAEGVDEQSEFGNHTLAVNSVPTR